MGAPRGNKNASGSHKGYSKSGAKKYLHKKMTSYVRKQRAWEVGSKTLAERKKSHGGFKIKKSKLKK